MLHPANRMPGKAYAIQSTYAKRIDSAKKLVPKSTVSPSTRFSKVPKGK